MSTPDLVGIGDYEFEAAQQHVETNGGDERKTAGRLVGGIQLKRER